MRRILVFLIIAAGFLPSLAFAGDKINISISRPIKAAYFIGIPDKNIDADEFDTLRLKIRSKRDGSARFFWATNYAPQMNEPKSLWFYIKKSEHARNYYFHVKSQNPNWIGFVQQLLILPDGGPEGLEILGGSALTGNLGANIKSGWLEFWGPKGREVIGSTINFIPSSTIFGRPINLYIYWLAGIFFIIMLARNYFFSNTKQKNSASDLKNVFHKTANITFIALLFLWSMLALNADYNYFHLFKSNFSHYFGKSIEEKRAISYGQEYYNFLVFAKEKLPGTAIKFGILSSHYAPELQPRIYLIPHVLVSNNSSELQYLLVFYAAKDQNSNQSDFSMFARLNANAYILKRRQ